MKYKYFAINLSFTRYIDFYLNAIPALSMTLQVLENYVRIRDLGEKIKLVADHLKYYSK